MTRHYFGFLVLLACFCLEAASRPSNNESSDNLEVEVPEELEQNTEQARALTDDGNPFEIQEAQPETTKDILNKIKAINNRLKKPQREQIKYNPPPFVSGGYILDKSILEKIQQIIASGKKHGLPVNEKEQSVDGLNEEVKELDAREENSRALQFVQPTLTSNDLLSTSVVPMPYMTNFPVLVMPTASTFPTKNEIDNYQSATNYFTRQRPSLPFQIQWPLAPLFPVLIKDPLLHYLGGGTWQTLIDYGQNADVCNRKQKSEEIEKSDDEDVAIETEQSEEIKDNNFLNLLSNLNSRQGRKIKKIKKRTISKTPSQLQTLTRKQSSSKASKTTAFQTLEDVKRIQDIFKPTPKPAKKPMEKETEPVTKLSHEEGDLKFPFSDFNWFGARKPVAPSPGFFINRLKVRRGGVAIAGPGGVATAGRGGTAVVGPGGLAYTQPGGVAVAGPQARVVALSSDTDLNSVVTRLQQQSALDSSVPRLLEAIPEGKVVATGPVVYYHPYTP